MITIIILVVNYYCEQLKSPMTEAFLFNTSNAKNYAFASGAITSLSRATNFSLIRADLPERSRK